MKIRNAAFAGQFYPKEKNQLEKQLLRFFAGYEMKNDCSAIISPHAGYIYSGKIAAKSFARLKKFEDYILLGQNHTGLGSAISIDNNEEWETPLGKIEINKELSGKIVEKSSAEFDCLAHIGEHSLEVQIPFLQYLFKEEAKKPKIIPIIISEDNLAEIHELGKVLASLSQKENFGIIASSDFSHFISEKQAKKLDFEAISYITNIDPKGFHAKVNTINLSICGYLPITCLLYYCKEKGLKSAEIEAYATSGDLTADYDNIVAYCSICFRNNKN